jgi:hypothetical protein
MPHRIFARIISLVSTDRFRFAVVLGFALAIGVVSWMVMPQGGLDMRDDILPSLWNWRAPWEEGTPLFPWATLILMPLRYFTPRDATALINSLSVVLIALLIKRFDGNVLFTVPVILSPIGYRLITTGQTDVIVLASIFLPAGFDLLLFWKPQVIAHAFWVRGLEKPKIYFVSGIVLLVVSYFFWGLWPRAILEFGQTQLIDGWWNFSLWPYSIPVGLLMVYLSIKKKDVGYGVIASPLLFPYVNGPSYIGLIATVAAKWPKFFGLCTVVILLYLILAGYLPSLNLPRIY